jgi:hypothetical protein
MNIDPGVAQQIVADYARLLEKHSQADRWPIETDVLPYPKQTIKSAIQASVVALTSTGQMTGEMREFLETAYVALADYVGADLARLMNEYQGAGADLAADTRGTHEKKSGDAWRRLSETGALAGQIARSIAEEADALRAEFRTLVP